MRSVDIGVSLLDDGLALVELLELVALLGGLSKEDATGGSLGLAGLTNLGSAADIDIGDSLLFAENGQVAQNIDRRNVCCNNAHTKKYISKLAHH